MHGFVPFFLLKTNSREGGTWKLQRERMKSSLNETCAIKSSPLRLQLTSMTGPYQLLQLETNKEKHTKMCLTNKGADVYHSASGFPWVWTNNSSIACSFSYISIHGVHSVYSRRVPFMKCHSSVGCNLGDDQEVDQTLPIPRI